MKNTIQSILACSSLLFSVNGWAQNTNLDFKNAIKIYNLSSYELNIKTEPIINSPSGAYYFTTVNSQFLHPTIAFQWKSKKNNFHEIELTDFSLNKMSAKIQIGNINQDTLNLVDGNELTTTSLSARYEYILNFNKTKDRKLVPSVGFSINLYYKCDNYSPIFSTAHPSSDSYLGSKVFVTPRLTHFLTSKFFIDLNVPLCFANTYARVVNVKDPTIPIADRKVSTIDFQLFPKTFNLRLGVGLKL